MESVTHVVLINFVGWSAVHTVQFGEELEPWDRRLRRVRGGAWVHNAGHRFEKCPETPIHVAEPFCAFVNRHEYTCNAENIVGAVKSKREQLVRIYGVGEDDRWYLKVVPRQGQQSDRQV